MLWSMSLILVNFSIRFLQKAQLEIVHQFFLQHPTRDQMKQLALQNYGNTDTPTHLVFYKSTGLERLLHNLRFQEINIEGIHPDQSANLQDICSYQGLKAIAKGSDFHDFLQERYVPSTWSEIAEYEHFPRYELARQLAIGRKVLDFGCGTGYGTEMLASKAKMAIGVDIDTSALDWAKQYHRLPNLEFQYSEDFLGNFEDNSFDMITCFEMIEHVNEADQYKALGAFNRVLKSNGVLLISTPNPNMTSLYGENPYHLCERNRKEFLEILKTNFRNIQLLDQHALTGVFFSQCSEQFELNGLHQGTIEDAEPLAYIAICSNNVVPSLNNIGFVDIERQVIPLKIDQEKHLTKTRLELYSKNSIIHSLEHQITTKDDEIVAKDNAIAAKDNAIAAKDNEIAAKDNAISIKDNAIAAKDM